jgi:hypothetical protein
MKRMIENLTGNYAASASVIDGTLILSLPDAITPVVWRLDLGQTRASALEVREREEGSFTLLLKTPRGDLNDIAAFATRGRAVAALMAVTRAMEQAHGQIRSFANDSESYNPTHLPVPVRGRKSKNYNARGQQEKGWIGGVIALALIVLLVSVIFNMGPKQLSSLSSASPAAGNPGIQSGVPVSADDFLKNR